MKSTTYVFRHPEHIERVMPPPVKSSTVWHYTTAEGALAILDSGHFWASSVLMLNDTEEILHGLALIESHWHQVSGSHPNESFISTWLRDARTKMRGHELSDSFALCASLEDKSQTQFALYGHYAVGLNSGMPLEKRASAEIPVGAILMTGAFHFGWRPMIYSATAKVKHVVRLFEELSALAVLASASKEHDSDVYLSAIECVIRSAVYMKDDRFAHEREVRLYGRAMSTNAEVGYHVGKFGVTPHLIVQADPMTPLGTGTLPLAGIRLGLPAADADAAERGLRIFLDRSGYSQVGIEKVGGSRR